jgi:hypothetical protein
MSARRLRPAGDSCTLPVNRRQSGQQGYFYETQLWGTSPRWIVSYYLCSIFGALNAAITHRQGIN